MTKEINQISTQEQRRIDLNHLVEQLSKHTMTIDELSEEFNCSDRRIYRMFSDLRKMGLHIVHVAPADISRNDIQNMTGKTQGLLAHQYKIVNPEIYRASTIGKNATVSSVHLNKEEMLLLAIGLKGIAGKHQDKVKSVWTKLSSIADEVPVELHEVSIQSRINDKAGKDICDNLHLIGTGKQIILRLSDEEGHTCCRITGLALGVQYIGERLQWKVSVSSMGGKFPITGVEKRQDYVLIDSVNISDVTPCRTK